MKRSYLACLALALALQPFHAKAASPAFDVASNYAGLLTYANNNGGTGWATPFFTYGSNVNAFLGSSGQIDTAGISFGIGNGGVQRSFSAQTGSIGYLAIGQAFQFSLQPGTVVAGGQFGFNIMTTVDLSAQVRLQYTSGDADYSLITTYYTQAGSTTQVNDTGVRFTANALAVSFSRGNGSYTLSLTPAGGTTTSLTNPYVGNVAGCAFSATNGATLYFNNLAVVPEPNASATLALGLGGLAVVYLLRVRGVVTAPKR